MAGEVEMRNSDWKNCKKIVARCLGGRIKQLEDSGELCNEKERIKIVRKIEKETPTLWEIKHLSRTVMSRLIK